MKSGITYELAKELKDAGFPTPSTGQIITDADMARGWHFKSIPNDPGEWYYEPSLSELIEVCGEDFDRLEHEKDSAFLQGEHIKRNRFRADGYVQVEKNHWSTMSYLGSTPEEAVAKLWLALNKK